MLRSGFAARLGGLLVFVVGASRAAAFEDTKVLPKGVRNLNIRTVTTNFDEMTDPNGAHEPLAHLLFQDLTFKQIAHAEDPLKDKQLRGFLLQNGVNESSSAGQFTADIKGHVTVVAPVAAYGLTEKMTLAVATPIYTASTSANVGFTPNSNAQNFLNLLSQPRNNQLANAREAATKLNDAVGQLNQKLRNNGFRELNDWHGQGLGDATLAVKYRAISNSRMALATTTGVVAPTGRQKDPDVLNDVPFGDGVWGPFAEVAVDELLPRQFFVDQFFKYTEELPTTRRVRAITYDELIEIPDVTTNYKMGDKIDAGTSLRYEPSYGLLSGIGYTYFRKFGDNYRGGISEDSKKALQRWTDMQANNAEFMLGYSTVPLYQAGHADVPFDMRVSYTKQITSRNMPISDLAQLDFDLFF